MPCGCALLAYLGLSQQVGASSARTIAFDMDWWDNNSWGVHNIVRDQISGTIAVFSDVRGRIGRNPRTSKTICEHRGLAPKNDLPPAK